MTLILNNIKGLGIHLVMSVFSIVLTLLAIVMSPIYGSQWVGILTIVCLYMVYILVYMKLSCYLKLESNKRKDYLVGILSMMIGIGIWGLAVYYSQYAFVYISKEVLEYWIPYKLYIFPSWLLFLYKQRNPLILLLGSLTPGILLSTGIKIKRYKCKLNN